MTQGVPIVILVATVATTTLVFFSHLDPLPVAR